MIGPVFITFEKARTLIALQGERLVEAVPDEAAPVSQYFAAAD